MRGEIKLNLKIIKYDKTYSIKYNSQKTILENLIDNNIKISAPCNGHGTCGKCKIHLIDGKVNTKVKNNNNDYLACQTYAEDDCTISLSKVESQSFSVLKDFKVNQVDIDPEIKKVSLKIDRNSLGNKSLTESVNIKLNTNYKFTLKALRKLSTLINESSVKQADCSFYKDSQIHMVCSEDQVIDIFNNKEDSNTYGIAVDIGTTTIVMSLVDIASGREINYTSLLNSQRQFGADVVSRIQYSMENSLEEISRCVKDDIIEGVEKLIDESNIKRQSIYELSISANNVMQHLLMGLFCDSIALYPFNTVTNDIVEMEFNELFKSRMLNCKVSVLPSISAYVGADIVSGLTACDFGKTEDICMLVDIGTNGEMALGNKERILCTSTAAGPAFEGANIENGVGSIGGAISSVKIDKNNIYYDTIGNKPALGICGSGIVDITAELFKNKIIDKTGKFDDNKLKNSFINITGDKEDEVDIVFTQKDIREIQMAKSAIRSGIEILIKKFNCSYDEIKKVYIAGGFGSKINLKNAAAIGLVPENILSKVELVGNSSLSGAVQYMLNKNTKRDMQHIIDIAENIDISMDDEFNRQFIDNMSF